MYVAIDLGGTRCRILTARSLDKPKILDRHEFVLSHKFEHDMQALVNAIRRHTTSHVINGIGFSVPGDLNPEKTAFVDPSDNNTEWNDKPVRAMLEREFGCPVRLENDGTAAALGEAYFGLGQKKNFTLIIRGTGIGGASVEFVDAKSVGTTLDWYRYFESWEETCGENKIKQRYGKEASQLSETKWGTVMRSFQKELSSFIDAASAKFVVFGGGIAIKQEARLLTVARHFPKIDIRVSHLGEDAGLYGALTLLRN